MPVFRFTAALTVGALALSGCMRADTNAEPVTFQVKPGFDQSRIIKFKPSKPVRTRIRKEDPRYFKEVSGVPCTLESNEFKASVVTPAKVNIPVVRGRVSPMRVLCGNGEYAATLHIPAHLQGVVLIEPSVAGLVVAAVGAAVVTGRDRWSYVEEGPIWIDLQKRTQ